MENNIESSSQDLKRQTAAEKTNRLLFRAAIFCLCIGVIAIAWSFQRISTLKRLHEERLGDLKKSNQVLAERMRSIQEKLDLSNNKAQKLEVSIEQLKNKIGDLFEIRRNLDKNYQEALAREENLTTSLLDLTNQIAELKQKPAASEEMSLDDRLLLELSQTDDENLKEFLAYTIENVNKIKSGESVTLQPIFIDETGETAGDENLLYGQTPSSAEMASFYAGTETQSGYGSAFYQEPQYTQERYQQEPQYTQRPYQQPARFGPYEDSAHFTASIIKVDPRYNLVVINRGLDNGVVEGMVGEVIHSDQVVGKIEIINTRNNLAAAFMMAGKNNAAIATGNIVRFRRIYN